MKIVSALPKQLALGVLFISGSLMGGNAVAKDTPVADCALRSAPFSVSLPAYDIMTRPAARQLAEQYYPGLFATLPAWLLSDTVPSLGTILTLEQLIARMDPAKAAIDKLDAELRALPVTTADKTARCARFDAEPQHFSVGDEPVQILVFQKINGYDHGRSVTAATEALERLSKDMGYGVTVTANGGAFVASNLAQFDVVVWNNVSGDTLTLSQRQAFEDYIHNGGGFLGVHASGGDSVYYWDWYRDNLLGAQFIGHPMDPQFQTATLSTHSNKGKIGTSLPATWSLNDEWYSFAEEPQLKDVDYVITIDESSYQPGNLAMGGVHPIAWQHCVKQGRAMYTAIGHREEVYDNKENIQLLKDALQWTAGQGHAQCKK
ncbi:MAG: ThuA domain-containing protein [Alteromonadaceae bacterium]|nr:ThuA domain-containing protein [Alteromonadaceae bacterium]